MSKSIPTTRIKCLIEERAEHAKVILVSNNKGGCGKTTLAAGLGLHAARTGKNVLFIDFDPQGNLSQRLGLEDGTYKNHRANTFFKIVDSGNSDSELMNLPLVIQYPYFFRARGSDSAPGVVAILGGSNLAAIEAKATRDKMMVDRYGREDYRELPTVFEAAIEAYLDYFDLIIIDTAPSLEGNVLTELAVFVADEILVPVDGLEAAAGIRNLMSWVDNETRDATITKPNLLFAMMKYQDDTVETYITGPQKSDAVKNVVFRALKNSLGEYVCDNGIKESKAFRNLLYCGVGRNGLYEELCGEILTKISLPRPNIFEYWGRIVPGLQKSLDIIDEKEHDRKPLFKIPRFVKEVQSDDYAEA